MNQHFGFDVYPEFAGLHIIEGGVFQPDSPYDKESEYPTVNDLDPNYDRMSCITACCGLNRTASYSMYKSNNYSGSSSDDYRFHSDSQTELNQLRDIGIKVQQVTTGKEYLVRSQGVFWTYNITDYTVNGISEGNEVDADGLHGRVKWMGRSTLPLKKKDVLVALELDEPNESCTYGDLDGIPLFASRKKNILFQKLIRCKLTSQKSSEDRPKSSRSDRSIPTTNDAQKVIVDAPKRIVIRNQDKEKIFLESSGTKVVELQPQATALFCDQQDDTDYIVYNIEQYSINGFSLGTIVQDKNRRIGKVKWIGREIHGRKPIIAVEFDHTSPDFTHGVLNNVPVCYTGRRNILFTNLSDCKPYTQREHAPHGVLQKRVTGVSLEEPMDTHSNNDEISSRRPYQGQKEDMTNVPADEEPRCEEYERMEWRAFGLGYMDVLHSNGYPGRVVWMGSVGGTVYAGITLYTPDKKLCRGSCIRGVVIPDVDLDNVYFCPIQLCTDKNGHDVIVSHGTHKDSEETKKGEFISTSKSKPRQINSTKSQAKQNVRIPVQERQGMSLASQASKPESHSSIGNDGLSGFNLRNSQYHTDTAEIGSIRNIQQTVNKGAAHYELYDGHAGPNDDMNDNHHSLDQIFDDYNNDISPECSMTHKYSGSSKSASSGSHTVTITVNSEGVRVNAHNFNHVEPSTPDRRNASHKTPISMFESKKPHPAPRTTASRHVEYESTESFRTQTASLIEPHSSKPSADHIDMAKHGNIDIMSAENIAPLARVGTSLPSDESTHLVMKSRAGNDSQEPLAARSQRDIFHSQTHKEEPEFREPDHHLNCTCPHCQMVDIFYWVAPEQQEDSTWITEVVPPKQFRRADFPLTMKTAHRFEDTIPGFVAPPSHREQYRGVWKGVQGDQNSCYMDASIFAMFSYITVFDEVLFSSQFSAKLRGDGRSTNEETAKYVKLRTEIQHVLKDTIVNRLRRNGLTLHDGMHELRKLLDSMGLVKGLTCDEKDPEEFLNLLLVDIFATPAPIELSNGQQSHLFHILAEKEDSMNFPTVQELLERTCLQERFRFSKVPPYLIMHLPRFGKGYKMYPKVFPSLELNVTSVMQNARQYCIICGVEATYECYECYKAAGENQMDAALFCDNHVGQYHKKHDRASHKPRNFTATTDMTTSMVSEAKDIMPEPKCELKLAAVLSIETSHYVTYVATSDRRDATWQFFDSMSDREETTNIPEVKDIPNFRRKLRDCREDLAGADPLVRRLVKDGYICIYVNPDLVQYNKYSSQTERKVRPTPEPRMAHADNRHGTAV